MVDRVKFQAFFSYAHHDGRTDEELTQAFSVRLENIVNSKLVNANFSIWRDVNRLRTCDRWNDDIETAITDSQIFILLLTPKWLESEYCQKEYEIFRRVEGKEPFGYYVVPILTRVIEERAHHLDHAQKRIYGEIKERQYSEVLAGEFLSLSNSEQSVIIERIADDIEGMIERLRLSAATIPIDIPQRRRSVSYAFTSTAHNYAEVDIISGGEIILREDSDTTAGAVFAQIDFMERLYVQSDNARVEFGVRRAYLTVSNGQNRLERVDSFQPAPGRSVSYVTRHDAPGAICVSIEPEQGKTSLAELSLPVEKGENRLARIATLPISTSAVTMTAELTISLCTAGLQIAGERAGSLARGSKQKIAAILEVAASKDIQSSEYNQIRRTIEVKDER